jgi:hypothetical protein
MKKLFLASTLMALIAAVVILWSPLAIASSCREDCRSYCCTDSRCTKEKEAKCYQDCLRDCDNAATAPKVDSSTKPPR